MDFELNDDQRLLKEMVDRFAEDAGGLDPHRAATRTAAGWSEDAWRGMAELGLTGVMVSESAGGLGGGGAELMILGEAIGRHLLAVPYLDTAILCGTALSIAPVPTRERALGELLDGSRRFALVAGTVSDVDGTLTGKVHGFSGCGTAEALIVDTGDAFYLVDAVAPGVSRVPHSLHGGGTAADVRLDGVRGEKIAAGDEAGRLRLQLRARRVAFLTAEALGAAEGAFEATSDYLKTRVQFGKPLASNQALQHRAAEMLVEIEQLRSAAILAACSLEEPDDDERERIMAAVSIVAAKTGRFVAQQAVQLHGGIGVTEEHAVGHWFLRLTAIGLLLDEVSATRTLAELGGFVAAAPYWEAAA